MDGKLEDPAEKSRKGKLQHGNEHDVQIMSVLFRSKDLGGIEKCCKKAYNVAPRNGKPAAERDHTHTHHADQCCEHLSPLGALAIKQPCENGHQRRVP